ncbi:vacuolar fusion protein MON1 [Suillus tomentosus]|nr:vacuolar fusion protein MON1 [Suillus tomentosus]
MGIVQALLSVFLDDGDKLRCINAGRSRITFLLRSPPCTMFVHHRGVSQSLSKTRSHLEYLHLQILSIVTASQLRRIFERRTNFDLRRLLDGSEPFLFSLLGRMELDLAMATSSLNCLQLDQSLRARVAEALVPTSKMKDTLYIILVARGQVITLVRPKKHSIHPADIHILVNTVYSPSIVNSPASASWIPVCLPKFNPAGFVNAYITFLHRPDTDYNFHQRTTLENNESADITGASHIAENSRGTPSRHTTRLIEDSGIGLVCISGGSEFETVRAWCDIVTQKLNDDGSLDTLARAVDSGKTRYFASQLGIPGLRHFVYKSRPHVQITLPAFEEPYDTLDAKRRIVTLYQIVHGAIHAKSGQTGNLKLQYIRTEKEIVMGWITQPFELYVVLSPRLPKAAVINAANAVTRWVKKEEGQLFLRDAPVF